MGLAQHSGFTKIEETTNQTESRQIKSSVNFLVRGENQSTWGKTS